LRPAQHLSKSHSSTITESEAERIRAAAEKQAANVASSRKESGATNQELTHKCLPERDQTLVFPTNSRFWRFRPKTLDRASQTPRTQVAISPQPPVVAPASPVSTPTCLTHESQQQCDRRYAQIRLKPSKLIHKTPLLIVIQSRHRKS